MCIVLFSLDQYHSIYREQKKVSLGKSQRETAGYVIQHTGKIKYNVALNILNNNSFYHDESCKHQWVLDEEVKAHVVQNHSPNLGQTNDKKKEKMLEGVRL